MHTSSINSKLGYITIVEEDGFITAILFAYMDENPSKLSKRAKKQIEEYLKGERKVFDLPIKMKGTDFQKMVWNAIYDIPFGETITYKDIGEKIGSKGYQAIGSACGKNPLPIIVPCHRVLGKDNIGGFSLGLDTKRALLDLEKMPS